MELPRNELLQGSFEPRVVIDREGVAKMWSDFQEMSLDLLEHSYSVHGKVPQIAVPLAGGVIPTLYFLEGAAQRARLQTREWSQIYSQLIRQDDRGPENIIFAVKSGRVQDNGGYINQYLFSRGVNRAVHYQIVDDIADTLETFRDMQSAFGEETEMVTPTCKEQTWAQIQMDSRLYVPESGIIPAHHGKDTWVFAGACMNRNDQQFPIVSSLQRMSGILYTHNGDPNNCALNCDLELLTKQDLEGQLDPIVYKINQIVDKNSYMQNLLFHIDRAKVAGKYYEVLNLAQTGFKHIMPKLLQAAA